MFRLLLIATALCAAEEARAEWNRAETSHFVIQADLSPVVLRGLATDLESIDALLRTITGVTAAQGRRRAEIAIFDQVSTVRRMASMPKFSGGITLYRELGSFVLVANDEAERSGEYNVRRALFHEYAHAFMRRFMPRPQPGWYVEGFATYFESCEILPDGHVRHGGFPLDIAGVFDAERHVNFEDVMSVSNNAIEGPPEDRVYAFGWVLAHHYLSHAPRSAEIGHYLDAVGAARSVANANGFFAGGVAALDKDMSAYVKALPPPREVALPPANPASVAIRAMRPGETALVQRRVTDLSLQIRTDSKMSPIEQIRVTASYKAAQALFDKYPDERELGLYTGRLALFAGENKIADTIADRLLAADPENPDVLAFKANSLIAATSHDVPKQFATVIARGRALIQRAQAVDPDNATAAEAMYRNYFMEQGSTPVTRRYLERAMQLDPVNIRLRLRAVELALRVNDYRGVIALLEPIANSPHDTGARTMAIEIIAGMRRRLSPPSPVARRGAAGRGTKPIVVPMPPMFVPAPPPPPRPATIVVTAPVSAPPARPVASDKAKQGATTKTTKR